MINHVRSLLLNSADTGYRDQPWEEFVPTDYRVRPVNAGMRAVRTALFGSVPDRYMLNYRLRQFMPTLHTPDLEPYTLRHDPRVTYLPFDDTPDVNVFIPKILHVVGDGDLALVGKAVADEARGTLFYRWKIEVISPTQVTVRKLAKPQTQEQYSFTLSGGRSNLIPLQSNLWFTITGTTGSVWIVELLARPVRSLHSIITSVHENACADVLPDVFGTRKTQVMRELEALWHDHAWPQYQLAGLLLGMADNLYSQGQAT